MIVKFISSQLLKKVTEILDDSIWYYLNISRLLNV